MILLLLYLQLLLHPISHLVPATERMTYNKVNQGTNSVHINSQLHFFDTKVFVNCSLEYKQLTKDLQVETSCY